MKAGIKPAFLIFLYLTVNFSSYAESSSKDLSKHPYWLKLIHYKKYPWGYRSEIDFPEFFLSTIGKTNPEQELIETIKASNNSKIFCKYPARFLWLNQEGLTKTNLDLCADYNQWLQGLSAKSLSLVFASYYPENPASAFGHLFLKIDHEESGHLPELDYIVNFAAAADEDGGIMYALKGLTGGYKGIFTIEKYYQKIQEYEIHESRDLWEFKLNLNRNEIQRVLAHLWELTYFAYFDYYFFDENCSYQILKLIDLSKDTKARTSFSPYEMPEENLHQIINQIGLKESPSQRSSLYKQTNARIDRLDSKDRMILKKSIQDKNFDLQNFSPELLDTLNYIVQIKQIQKKSLTNNDKKLNHQILVEISKRPKVEAVTVRSSQSPLEGHGSHKLTLGQGILNNHYFTTFKFKPAFHEMMDNDKSYLQNSSLNILGIEGRYFTEKRKFKLQELVILETQVLSPFSMLTTKPSWGADFSIRTLNFLNCENCQSYQLKLSRGLSFNYLNDRLTIYSMLHGQINNLVHKEAQIKNFRIGPELEIGVIAKIYDQLKMRSFFSEQYNFTNKYSPQSHLNTTQLSYYPTKNSSINLEMKKIFLIRSAEVRDFEEYVGLFSLYY